MTTSTRLDSVTGRLILRSAAIGATTLAASGVGFLAGAAAFARAVLTPDRERPDDVSILAVGDGEVTLGATPDTVIPGRYGLWLDGGRGHVRLGEIVAADDNARSVTREVLGVDRGELEVGPARWNSYYYGDPPDRSLSVPTELINYPSELGLMPAWVVPPASGATGERWAVLVHGRGARREETIRAIPTLRASGWTCLTPSYRNDVGVPRGPDGRYSLGLAEWRDIESAIRYAVGRGAQEILLVGWSMGGAIVLQALDRSELAPLVSRVVLDAPVLDWGDVLAYHARVHRVPAPLGSLSRTMMGRQWGKRLVGIHDVLDVAQTDWVSRCDELSRPMLILHSVDDDFVPVGPSQRLAAARPEIVTLEEWQVARHCKEWNTDAPRWEAAVRRFVS